MDETIITLLDGKCDFIFSFYDEKLLQEPFLYTEILESKIYPVTLKDAFGNPLFSLDDAHLPLLNYTLDSYMGRLVNRKLVQYPKLNLQTKFISSMSELLKNMVLNGQGIAWLPEYSIINELKDGKLMILNDKEMSIPIKGYVYRMNTRLNSYAEQFWEFLKGMESIRTMIK